jgi:predicted metal-dependent hydrolase
MKTKKEKMAGVVAQWHGHEIDPHIRGYFDCFNRGLYYEAHDVLEQLWLKDRHGANGALFKGMIQLAGAFVHLQKNRLRPAGALFKLAAANLEKYPATHEQLNLAELKDLIVRWLKKLEAGDFAVNPLTASSPPKLVPPM